MTAYDDLVAQLRRYDDDAWAALANRGLLRRARRDLETVAVSLESADPVVVRVGEHGISFGDSGASGATCSCPAATICQHVITAALWLASSSAPAPETDLHGELMAIDAAALASYAGRAGLRWAAQYVADLDDDQPRISQGQLVQLSFTTPRLTFRFMGGGVAGLIPDVKLPSPEKYAAAAVLAYQRAHGAEGVPIEPVQRRETATTRARADGRERFLRAVGDLLLDTVRLGASHLSPAVHQRYETIAVWAQGVELHRLALLLRRLADQVELLLDRSARADEHALLDEAALAYALVSALRVAGDEAPSRLAGQARTIYSSVRSMELVGLGGTPWKAASGYRGLTCLFWWVEEQRFVSWTDARPESMRTFEPRARWTQPAPWTGLRTPALAVGRTIRLTDAQVSPTGRLSGVERTQAWVGPLVEPPWADMPVVSSWTALEHRVRGGESLLDQPDPLREWVLLRPESWDPGVFDPIRQTVWWVLRDDAGRMLPLSLRWTPLASHGVQRLESLTPDEVPPGALVVARVFSRSGSLGGEPLSVIRGERQVDVLHFDEGAATAPARSLVAGSEEDDEAAPVPLPGPLVDMRSWLLSQMERGTGAVSRDSLLDSLSRRHRAARDVGLTVFPEVGAVADPAAAMLQSHYLGLQVAHVLA